MYTNLVRPRLCLSLAFVIVLIGMLPAAMADDAIKAEAITIYEQNWPADFDRWMAEAADGEFTWGGPDFMRGELQMYCITGDPVHVERVLDWAETMMANRSDRRGIRDDYRNEIVKGWVSNSYSFGRNYTLGSAAGMQCAPMSEALYYIYRDPSLRAAYGERADAVLRDVIEVMEQFDRDYREGPGADEGHYYNLYNGMTWGQWVEPLNLQSFHGSTAANLYLITGEEKYRQRATRIARYMKNRLRPVDDRVVWPYSDFKLKYDENHVEDFSHAGVNALFAFECYRAGIVFDEQDMKRIANTLKFLFLGPEVGHAHLLNGERVAANLNASRRWVVYGKFDEEVLRNELAWTRFIARDSREFDVHTAATVLAYASTPFEAYEPLNVAIPSPVAPPLDPELVTAAEAGDVDSLRSLIEQGADLAGSGVDGQTALHRAAEQGRLEAMRVLIDAGADSSAIDRRGYNVLLAAAAGGHADAVQLLLDHGADINATDKFGRSALQLAGNYGRVDVVRTLLDAGADIQGNPVAGSPIHGAAAVGSIDIIRMLLDAGEDVNRLDARYKATPLYLAATYDHPDTVAFLLERGGDLTIRMKHKRSPLDIAVVHGHLEVARLLIEHGADPLAEDRLGFPLPQRADIDGHTEMAALLRSYEQPAAMP